MPGDVTMDKIVSLSRRRGFVFPSSEIYGGMGSTFDYGHYGVLMKNNIREKWFEAMGQDRDDIVAIDSAVILHPKVWEASGHVAGFTDPLIDCRTCKLRFRADKLEDANCGRKPSKRPGETPECDLTEPRQFNLMFETTVGALQEEGSRAFLRPETAQGIFINFKNVLQLARRRPPFGIAQIGKSFRNEITPGNFLFRVREFEQMEMEYFVPPDESERWYRYWIDERLGWYLRYGLRRGKPRGPPPRPGGGSPIPPGTGGTPNKDPLRPGGEGPALPPAGRDRHAVGVHHRRADALRRHGHGARPRFARAGTATGRRRPRLARRCARTRLADAEGRLALRPGPLHRALRRLAEPELPIETRRVARVQHPTQLGVRAVVDGLANELDAETAASILLEHVNVCEVHERDAVGEGAREADLPVAVVEADHALRLPNEPLDDLARPSFRPVGLVREVIVNGVHVD